MSGRVVVEVEAGAPPRRREALAALLGGPLVGIAGPLVLWPALVAHVALPVMAAGHLAGRAGRERFAAEDRSRIVDGLEWLLGLYGWASLASARPPWRPGPRAVRLRVPPPPTAPPGAGAALARLVTGLPAAAGALLAGVAALVPWLALVASLLVAGRAPAPLRRVPARVLAVQAAVLCRQAAVAQPGSGPSASSRSSGTGRTRASIIGQWRSASAASRR